MDFFRAYNIVQIASSNSDAATNTETDNTKATNTEADNNQQLQQIVLKPLQSAKTKIKHFRLLKYLKKNESIIEQYIDPLIETEKSIIYIEWNYQIQQIGEYEYYYLNAVVNSDISEDTNDNANKSKIYLTIVKKSNLSIYVFLEYPQICHYIPSIILYKYLKNYWEIENY